MLKKMALERNMPKVVGLEVQKRPGIHLVQTFMICFTMHFLWTTDQ